MTVYIERENVDHVVLTNDTGADLDQYEFAVVGGIAAIADEDIDNGSTGSFHVEEGMLIQSDDLVTAEDTFGTVNQPVYWNPATNEFSDTATSTYYLVGYLQVAKDSAGVIIFQKLYHVELVGTVAAQITALETAVSTTIPADYTAADAVVSAAFAAADAAQLTDSGRPFFKTATLTSAAAGTAVAVLDDTSVEATEKAYVAGVIIKVNGATAWSDSTATVVYLQDSSGTITGLTIAKAGLTANALISALPDTNVTVGDAIAIGSGFTADEGLQIVGDGDFAAGSDLVVTVYGYIK